MRETTFGLPDIRLVRNYAYLVTGGQRMVSRSSFLLPYFWRMRCLKNFEGGAVMVKKILITLDSSPFTLVAMDHAIELGKVHNAEVTGMAIVHRRKLTNVGPIPIGGDYYAKNLRNFRLAETNKNIDEVIGSFKSTASEAGIDYRIERQDGDPFHLMVLQASKYDLIITGLRSMFDYDVVPEPRNLLWRMASAGVAPILAVGREFRPIRRVFVVYNQPLDPSSVLSKLLQLSLWPDVSLRVGFFGQQDSDSGKKLVVDVNAECSAHGYKVECKSLKGAAKTQMFLQAAEWKADLIAINEGSRRFLFKKIFNDNVMYAIQHSNTPLFLA